MGAAVFFAACSSGGGGAADGGGGSSGGGTGGSASPGAGGASSAGGTDGSGAASGAGGSAPGADGAAGVVGTGGWCRPSGEGGTGPAGAGGTSGTGTGGTSLQFIQVSPQTSPAAYFNSVACGSDACYASRMGTTAQYRYINRLANTATTVDDFSTGLDDTSVGSLLVDGADNLYVTQGSVAVLLREPTAPSFIRVADQVASLATARHALLLDGNGTLFVGTMTGVVALPSCGSTFVPVGSGLAFAYAIVSDGTTLYAASKTVKVLPGSTGTWMDAGSNSPTSVQDLAFDRAGRLYATSTELTATTAGVYRLSADGSTWQDVTRGLSRDDFSNLVATNIAFDAQNNGYLLRGVISGTATVARLAPGGTSWTTMNAPGFPLLTFRCGWLAIDALGRLVAACSEGLFRSTPLY